MDEIKITQGFAFHPGDVVLLELQNEVTLDALEDLRKSLKKQGKRLGIEFGVLAPYLRVVRDGDADG